MKQVKVQTAYWWNTKKPPPAKTGRGLTSKGGAGRCYGLTATTFFSETISTTGKTGICVTP